MAYIYLATGPFGPDDILARGLTMCGGFVCGMYNNRNTPIFM
ncbi:unnamed protein product [Penicillium camemberti]|uniref:Str. FM013 n=1 Tax=Penicillium camemberti (strain FM 013) TaxID=1429867 RepID=A0A0G4NTR8_PENC3|nr:unnamed protein product [Penicillium camemberti]